MERVEEMKEDLNILIIHAHWNNRGDEAAIRAMIDSLRSSLPIGKMRIMIFASNVVDFPYGDIEILKPFPLGRLDLIDCVTTLFSLGKIAITERGKRFLMAVDEADAVIHAPGGPSIGDIYRRGYWSYAYLYRLLLSRIIKKKPIFFYAPSMGPFSRKFDGLLQKLVLRGAGAVVLREGESGEYLNEQLGLESIITCDSALQNEIPDDYLDRYDNLGIIIDLVENRRVVGMTITDLKWHPIHGKVPHLENRIRESLMVTIEKLLEKGYSILLIPQVFGDRSDVPLLQQYAAVSRSRVIILPDNVDSYGQQVLISRLHSVIGMRYHSNIFAAKGGVPFLPISYEHKMKGFMDSLGLTDLTLDVRTLTARDIIEKFEYVEHNYGQLKVVINNRIPDLRELSKKTTEIIAARIKQTTR